MGIGTPSPYVMIVPTCPLDYSAHMKAFKFLMIQTFISPHKH